MLTVSDLTKRIGERVIVEGLSFTVNRGERLGVIGPNGAGKTTVLAMLAGDLEPDRGSVTFAPGVRAGYLRQGFADRPEGTLGDLLDIPTEGLVSAERRLHDATLVLATLGDDADADLVFQDYDAALAEFERAGGYAAAEMLAIMLERFGLPVGGLAAGYETPLAALSGGQKTRAGLAGLLTRQPDILLLDEPTNHLDLDAASWLEETLLSYDGAVIVVSHDRAFLDRVATHLLVLGEDEGAWRLFVGGYSDYLAAKEREAEEQAAAYRRQQERIARIEAGIRSVSQLAAKVEGGTQHDYIRGRMKKVARLAVVRERKLERLLESEDRVEKPQRRWGLAAELPPPPPSGNRVIEAIGVTVRFGERTVLAGVDLFVGQGDRIAITGPNGGGKTTLLRTLCGELQPDAGSVIVGPSVIVGRFAQEQETLDLTKSALAQVRSIAAMSESDARTFLHRFLFGGDMALRPAAQLSYGERARLALALVVLKGANLLVLDEPLNHLDLPSQEQFEEALQQYQGTLLMVLHDRAAIARLATRTLELRDGRLRELPLMAE